MGPVQRYFQEERESYEVLEWWVAVVVVVVCGGGGRIWAGGGVMTNPSSPYYSHGCHPGHAEVCTIIVNSAISDAVVRWCAEQGTALTARAGEL